MFNTANEHYSEKAECIFYAATVSVCSISSSHSVCVWPFLRPMSHQEKCVCLQVFSCGFGMLLSIGFIVLLSLVSSFDLLKWVCVLGLAGFYHPIMSDICISQL